MIKRWLEHIVRWTIAILLIAGSPVHASDLAPRHDADCRNVSQLATPDTAVLMSPRLVLRIVFKPLGDPVPPPTILLRWTANSLFEPVVTGRERMRHFVPLTPVPPNTLPPPQGPPLA